ncbi:MAG: hypothetical protein HQL38_14265 [Alphaproteobacteria bacterium]|nr:hypothetical protein [Alphaproteobacteria bacterium]
MAESRRLSVLPPDGDDDERLRRALGQPAAEAPAPSPASPAPARVPAAKVTVSVRMSPDTQARLAAIGDAIGWSSNKIMTHLVENQATVLSQAFERDGEAGVLKLLRAR